MGTVPLNLWVLMLIPVSVRTEFKCSIVKPHLLFLGAYVIFFFVHKLINFNQWYLDVVSPISDLTQKKICSIVLQILSLLCQFMVILNYWSFSIILVGNVPDLDPWALQAVQIDWGQMGISRQGSSIRETLQRVSFMPALRTKARKVFKEAKAGQE